MKKINSIASATGFAKLNILELFNNLDPIIEKLNILAKILEKIVDLTTKLNLRIQNLVQASLSTLV